MIKAILFDLDGTLLPMDYDLFVKTYFSLLCKRIAPLGYNPDALIDAVWKSTYAMYKNDGKNTNEKVFWNSFKSILGETIGEHISEFDNFYETEFSKCKEICGFDEKAKTVVELIKNKNIKMAVATNPIFPRTATLQRIAWAGLDKDDFALITTYENFSYSKPNPQYFTEIAKILQVSPSECLMVGNDVSEDMIAEKTGMKVFLLTDCLLNKKGEDITRFNQGTFDDLINYVSKII